MPDQKITQLTEDTAPVTGDLIAVVQDPAGSPVTKKMTIDTISTVFSSNSMARQAVINGNFDICQRWGPGASVSNPASGTFVLDRWKVVYSNSGTLPTTINHLNAYITPGDIFGSFIAYNVSPNGAGSGFGAGDYYQISQPIENGVRFLCGASKKITLSFWAKSTITSKKLGFFIDQIYGTGGTPSSTESLTGSNVTLTSSWQKFTFTFTTNTLVSKTFGTNNDDYLSLRFLTMWGTSIATYVGAGTTAETFVGAGDIFITQVQLCVGDVALPFQPKSFAQELYDCQRYYQKSYSYTVLPGTNTAVGSHMQLAGVDGSGIQYTTVYLRRPMRMISPTVVLYAVDGTSGNWLYSRNGASGNASASVNQQNECSMAIGATVSGSTGWTTQAYVQGHWTADTEL